MFQIIRNLFILNFNWANFQREKKTFFSSSSSSFRRIDQGVLHPSPSLPRLPRSLDQNYLKPQHSTCKIRMGGPVFSLAGDGFKHSTCKTSAGLGVFFLLLKHSTCKTSVGVGLTTLQKNPYFFREILWKYFPLNFTKDFPFKIYRTSNRYFT